MSVGIDNRVPDLQRQIVELRKRIEELENAPGCCCESCMEAAEDD